jgi:hypothetical protein
MNKPSHVPFEHTMMRKVRPEYTAEVVKENLNLQNIPKPVRTKSNIKKNIIQEYFYKKHGHSVAVNKREALPKNKECTSPKIPPLDPNINFIKKKISVMLKK